MKYPLITWLIMIASLVSCKKDGVQGSKVLNFQTFRVIVPSNWKKFSLQGFDSQIGGMTNGQDTLNYDYGWYSYNFKNETTATHNRTNTTIDGRYALIVQPKNSGQIIGVYIQVNTDTKFILYGNNIEAEATALKIFESVTFK